ncbi:MAG: hypothetical protein J5634_01135 [Bacilli bacterium]|nr:hypothetical protein [Bacilli bacterium]
MYSKLVYANILIILSHQARFFFHLFQTRRSAYYQKIIKYICYSVAFYLVGGYVGTLFYMIYASNIIMQIFNVSKSILFKLLVTILAIYLYLYTEDYTFINNIPYLVLLSNMWIRPYIKVLDNKFTMYLEKILIIAYAYIYKLYMLSFFEGYFLIFNIVSKYFKKTVNYFDKKIS